MNLKENGDPQDYETDIARRKPSGVRALHGFLIGLAFSALILSSAFLVWFAVALGGGEMSDGFITGLVMLVVVALVLPFIQAYLFGRGESETGFSRRRDYMLGDGAPLKIWHGTVGRINRLAYTAAAIPMLISFYVLGIVVLITDESLNEAIVNVVVMFLLFIVYFAIGLFLMVRRLHDIGRSGWYGLLLLIPYVGLILPLVLFVWSGNGHRNKYGPQPPKSIVGLIARQPSRSFSSEHDRR